MKVSLNSIYAFNKQNNVSLDTSNLDQAQLLDIIGSKLGAIENFKELKSKYSGIYIVKVVSCTKHPDADKLSVCLIDDNNAYKNIARNPDGLIQVVCGAPNVKAGINAIWIPPGKVVPSTQEHDPFTLSSKEIRGVVSNGMLASLKELDFGESHDGIVELSDQEVVGSDLSTTYNLNEDIIIDLENKMFTHRPDCFGLLGIARELSGVLGSNYKSPDWYKLDTHIEPIGEESLPLKFSNELPTLVKRFCLITIKDVEIKPSPLWLQIELSKIGQRSINNVVDLTNYLMQLTAQPLHAYDYDKVKTRSSEIPTIVVRNPKPGETIELLNGKTIEPRNKAIMIATDKELIGVGGVMGGGETEVDYSTKNIILECANFDMYSIRRTSMAHGLFTDAVTRFTKGQSPLQNVSIINKSCHEIIKLAGGQIASNLIDNNNLEEATIKRGSIHPSVVITKDFINSRLGLNLSVEEIASLLKNVEFEITENSDELVVKVPFWRTDIELREDIVEEVGRLYGYDKIPLNLPQRSLKPVTKNKLLELKDKIRNELTSAGANEVLTYSFIHGDLIDKAHQDRTKAFSVANALSPQLQYYRLSLLPSLLDKVYPNIKAGFQEFALYEIGKTHSLEHFEEDNQPSEFEYTALVVSANDKLKKAYGPAYYQAKRYLETLCPKGLSYKPFSEDVKSHSILQPFNEARSALVYNHKNELIGVIGEFKAEVTRKLKLPSYCAGFEIDTTKLFDLISNQKDYDPIPRFPYVIQDVTLKVEAVSDYAQIFNNFNESIKKTIPSKCTFRLNPLDIFQNPETKETKNYTFRLEIANYERTLTDQEVNLVIEDSLKKLQISIKAERV